MLFVSWRSNSRMFSVYHYVIAGVIATLLLAIINRGEKFLQQPHLAPICVFVFSVGIYILHFVFEDGKGQTTSAAENELQQFLSPQGLMN